MVRMKSQSSYYTTVKISFQLWDIFAFRVRHLLKKQYLNHHFYIEGFIKKSLINLETLNSIYRGENKENIWRHPKEALSAPSFNLIRIIPFLFPPCVEFQISRLINNLFVRILPDLCRGSMITEMEMQRLEEKISYRLKDLKFGICGEKAWENPNFKSNLSIIYFIPHIGLKIFGVLQRSSKWSMLFIFYFSFGFSHPFFLCVTNVNFMNHLPWTPL